MKLLGCDATECGQRARGGAEWPDRARVLPAGGAPAGAGLEWPHIQGELNLLIMEEDICAPQESC